MRGIVSVVAVAALLLGAVGCSATSVPSPHRTAERTAASAPPPPAPPPAAGSTTVPHGADPVVAPTPDPTPTKPRGTFGDGMVSWYRVEIPIDNGPEPHAMGTVTTDQHGVPVAYHVAPDDLMDFISERFGFFERPSDPSYNSGMNYLETINQVRRGGYPWSLYAGDTLNLSASTITSVGDQNGVVKHEAPPDPMPPQR